MKIRGFWSDSDGLSIADVVVWVTLPPWLYTAYRYALAADLSGNQVDFFLVLTYPLLLVLGGRAISDLPPLRRMRIQLSDYEGRDDRDSSPRI
ncbi:MAG: hypothetical protein PWP44_925 [Thermacetogenium sp.]|nr:hypothetical protein [Thermacetogenium sp.]